MAYNQVFCSECCAEQYMGRAPCNEGGCDACGGSDDENSGDESESEWEREYELQRDNEAERLYQIRRDENDAEWERRHQGYGAEWERRQHENDLSDCETVVDR